MSKIRSGGFVLVEFAIALPLLILVMYGLAIVSIEIFKLGKDQLADYVLESEAQYVMERITHEVRLAKKVEIHNDYNEIKIIYHSVDDDNESYRFNKEEPATTYWLFSSKDVLETQFIYTYQRTGRDYLNLYATRQNVSVPSNPITGENSFGDTKINSLKFSKLNDNVLHIELEMESLVTPSRIKVATAVFMPSCEELVIKNE